MRINPYKYLTDPIIIAMAKQNTKRTRRATLKRWKTFNEKEILERYFKVDPHWTRKTIIYLRDMVELSEEQIYKWGYERKRKAREQQDKEIVLQHSFTGPLGSEDLINNCSDYNQLVDELFPVGNNMSERLTRDEKKLYDGIKEELLTKDAIYQNMNDLDKLLCERINASEVILNNQEVVGVEKKTKTHKRKCSYSTGPEAEQLEMFSNTPSCEDVHKKSIDFTPTDKKRLLKAKSKDETLEKFSMFELEEEQEPQDFAYLPEENIPELSDNGFSPLSP